MVDNFFDAYVTDLAGALATVLYLQTAGGLKSNRKGALPGYKSTTGLVGADGNAYSERESGALAIALAGHLFNLMVNEPLPGDLEASAGPAQSGTLTIGWTHG